LLAFIWKIAVNILLDRDICKMKPVLEIWSIRRKAAMLGVLFGQGEVMVLIIVTAVVVFIAARGRKRR
jgi:hypothetical protein